MNVFSRRSLSLLGAALALTWLGGCDATRIDQGADVPLAEHLAALSTADTPGQAETALRGLFNKVGIRTAWQGNVAIDAHPYGLYSVTDDEIADLAERHAAFVAGRQASDASFGSAHAIVVDADARAMDIVRNLPTAGVTPISRTPVTIGVEDALAILSAQARAALAAPEAPESAIALAAATTSLDGVPTLASGDALSPAQAFLYSIWLHRNGPLMYAFSADASTQLAARATLQTAVLSAGATAAVAGACLAGDCPGDLTACDPCCGGNGKFTDITFQYNGSVAADVRVDVTAPRSFAAFPEQELLPGQIFNVSGAARTNDTPGFNGTLGNEVEIRVDGTEIDYAPYGDPNDPDANQGSIHTSCSETVLPGDVYGDFLVVAVATQNMGLCSSLSTCVAACQTQLNQCLSRANGDANQEAKCEAEFRACDQNCHDQGSVSD